MKVKILFFGVLSELTNSNQIIIENIDSLQNLISLLENKYEKLKSHKYQISLNKEIAHNTDILLKDMDEIALLPPFAGG